MYELEYKYELINDKNTEEENRILSTYGERYEYLYNIKSSLLYDLAKDDGILDDLVKNFESQIYFDCYVFPPKEKPEYAFPFIFYNSTIDFLKKLNAYVCVWPQK